MGGCHILHDKLGASNVTVYNITPDGGIGFAVGIAVQHNLTKGYNAGPVIYILILDSNGTLPLTNIGVSLSRVSTHSNYVGFDGYTTYRNSTVQKVLLSIVPSKDGNTSLEITFTLTPAYEFLIYHYPGNSETFTFYQNVTIRSS